jgi:multicomponent Na+:H+ antiporter subunit D
MGLLALAIGMPLVGACLTVFVPARRQELTAIAAAGTSAVVALALAVQVWRDGPSVLTARGPAGVALVLMGDGMAAALIAMAGVVGLFVTVFAALGQGPEPAVGARYWPLLLLLWAAANAVFAAGDLLSIYLLFELVALTAVALAVLGGDRRALVAGMRYFYAELAASATFLLGVALVWADAGTVVLADLPPGMATTTSGGVGMALMTVGLLVKVPLVPLHFWLPAAHSLAPGPVSPFLSAVVVKTAFAVLVRLWFVGSSEPTAGVAQLLGALGALAVVWGSVNALRAAQLKVLIAHSTVAQIGFMFLLPPMLLAGSWDAWSGGVVQAVAHALAKAAALMAAAVFLRHAAGDTVADLAGTAARCPVATFAFGMAGLSLVGLPPSGGFVAKWHFLVASFQTGQWWWALVIVVGSLLTASYLMRVVKQTFAPSAPGPDPVPVRDHRQLVALALALVALGLGLRPTELLELVQVGAPMVAGGAGS